MKKTTSGFTLLELIISIAIIGLLAAVAVPSYGGYINTSCMTVAASNMQGLRTLQQNHNLEYGRYVSGIHDGNNPTASTLEKTTLKWIANDNDEYKYVITVGSTGKISNSYKIQVTGLRACSDMAVVESGI